MDLGTGTKQLGAKEHARRKEVRDSRLSRKIGSFRKYMRIGDGVVENGGLVPGRTWRGQAVRLKLRRQMAAAAGRKESVSLSLVMEVNKLEVEEERSTMAKLAWA